jgi:type I restriction enzyme S subunit
MSKLENMIAELCPIGAENKMLDEVFIIKNGYTPSKSKKEFWKMEQSHGFVWKIFD